MGLNKRDRFRDMLAQETAKIITTEGVRDYQRAKRKALERLGNSYHGSLPSNFEIHQAILDYHNTFSINHQNLLYELRKVAHTVMKWFENFSPYLVGSVLEGTANTTTPITIHIKSDTLEFVIDELNGRCIKPTIVERSFKLNSKVAYLPILIFDCEECEIEVVVFNLRQQHQISKSRTNNWNARRMNLKSLEIFLDQSSDKLGLTL